MSEIPKITIMKIKTQWGVIAYDPQAIACNADLIEMADAAFGEHAGEWLEHRTGYRPGMTCAEAWEIIAARAMGHAIPAATSDPLP
jgi:hypothetical protein